MPFAPILGLVLAASALVSVPVGAQLAGFVASDPSAPPVTEENLLENERFWPYRVRVMSAWPPEGVRLPARTVGVLVRVEPSGVARVDFGADGRFEIPIEKTDLVERANRVRLGTLHKAGPNFVHAIGPRLVDTAFQAPRNVPIEQVFEPPGFLAVFAAPEEFAGLAESLGPLHGRHGVWTVLFPQGQHHDAVVRRELRELRWEVPFVYDVMSEGYTRSRLSEGTPLPAVMLQTPEGRLLFQSSWSSDALPRLVAALDAAFAGPVEPAANAPALPKP